MEKKKQQVEVQKRIDAARNQVEKAKEEMARIRNKSGLFSKKEPKTKPKSEEINVESIYNNRCASCHGRKGEKFSYNAPIAIANMTKSELVKALQEFKVKSADNNYYDMKHIKKNYNEKLSMDDIEKLSAYIASFRKRKINVVSLYAKCAECHGENGEKHAFGRSKAIGKMSYWRIARKLKKYKTGQLDQYGLGRIMKGEVGSLDKNKIEALSRYIPSLSKRKLNKK
jgi:cytochrome c553